MHQLPLDIVAAFVGVYAALQALSVLLTFMNAAEKRLEGRSSWVAQDGTAFEEFSPAEIESSNILKRDFEESVSESAFTPATIRSGF